MKLWKIYIPLNFDYAQCASIYVEPEKVLCGACDRRENPELRIEWEDGSDIIGDFTGANTRLIAKESIVDSLVQKFRGIEKSAISLVDHPNLYKPTNVKKKLPKRIWLPYEGPKLFELKVTKEIILDKSSTCEIRNTCDNCGAVYYKKFMGIETKNSRTHTLREPGKGFFVKAKDIKGFDFFKPLYANINICTDKVKDFIEESGYSNIEFLEVGEVI